MTSGQIAYDAYCKNSGGVSLVSGDGLPAWAALPPRIQEAWEAAADAVIAEVDC